MSAPQASQRQSLRVTVRIGFWGNLSPSIDKRGVPAYTRAFDICQVGLTGGLSVGDRSRGRARSSALGRSRPQDGSPLRFPAANDMSRCCPSLASILTKFRRSATWLVATMFGSPLTETCQFSNQLPNPPSRSSYFLASSRLIPP